MGERRPRWENEMLGGAPIPDDIVCKTCAFKMPDVVVRGRTVKRHSYGSCEVYSDPYRKPTEIIFDGAECKYYEKE